MRTWLSCVFLGVVAFGLGGAVLTWRGGAAAQDRAGGVAESQVRFEAVDVYVDSGESPLAAYQFELVGAGAELLLAGLEGGESAAFREAPFYDVRAFHVEDRVIVAAFHTGSDLPRGRTRVARLHFQVEGGGEPEYGVRLMAAADAGGERIEAVASVEKAKETR